MPIYQISIQTHQRGAVPYETALSAFCTATTCFEESEGSPIWWVHGYSEQMIPTEVLELNLLIQAASLGEPMPTYTLVTLPALDWVQENQRSFPPIMAGRFIVYGSHHRDSLPLSMYGLCIDAANAFGTGEHASTKGCLLALSWLSKHKRFQRVLDIGTGSGILSLASHRLWPRASILATDIDAPSVITARFNARLNQMPNICFAHATGYQHPLIRHGAPYDLILSNILARPLCRLARDKGKYLSHGGYGIASGLTHPQARMVIHAYRQQSLILVKTMRVGDWSTLVFQKK
jgi:ribosomal protein L11 methyltransferase